MSRALILVAACWACGGTADDWQPMAAPDGGVTVDSGATEAEPRVIPLCPGESGPEPDDCQRLVYNPEHGYCNRWVVCP